MAVNKRKWYQRIYFEFYIRIPLLTVQTRLLTEAVERMTYDILRVSIKLWKWEWSLQLYKRPGEYAIGGVTKKHNRVNAWLRRKLTRTTPNPIEGERK